MKAGRVACSELGIEVAEVCKAPQITKTVQNIIRKTSECGTEFPQTWVEYLHASDSEDARKVLDAYYSLPKRRAINTPIEAFCLKAQVSPLRILEVITATCVRLGAQASTVIAAVNHPRVVQMTVNMALTGKGIDDRNALHKATGFFPAPKGAQTNIMVTQNANSQANAQAFSSAPPPESTIRRLTDRFNDARRISESSVDVIEEDPIETDD